MFELDFEAFQAQLVELAMEDLSNQSDEYITGWIIGVNFVCEVLQELAEKKNNLENFNFLHYRPSKVIQ